MAECMQSLTEHKDNASDPFVALTQGLKISDLVGVIPKDCFEPDLVRQSFAILLSIVASIGAWTLLVLNPYWWLLPPLWFLAGTCAWGLYVIGHDCGHSSFSKSRSLNYWVGHLMLTPLLYPFHSWRLLHNHHHANTNSLERDIDWRPLTPSVLQRLPVRSRMIYQLIRTNLWWAGTLHQWATMAFNPKFFEDERSQKAMTFSIGVVIVYAAIFFPTLVYFTGLWGLFSYFLMPWLVVYGWFSTVTLMHHTNPEIPFLDRSHWNPVAANLTATIYCRYPRWMEILGHEINVHIPHHVAPSIPFYHLRRAHQALKAHYPALVRETKFSWSLLFKTLGTCQLFDRRRGRYVTFKS